MEVDHHFWTGTLIWGFPAIPGILDILVTLLIPRAGKSSQSLKNQGNLGPPKGIYTGWWLTYPSEKYEFVSWDDNIPNIGKNKKCSKPPTSYVLDPFLT